MRLDVLRVLHRRPPNRLLLHGCTKYDGHLRVFHGGDGGYQIGDLALLRVVIDDCFTSFKEHLRSDHPVDAGQCRPHRLDTTLSGHAGNSEFGGGPLRGAVIGRRRGAGWNSDADDEAYKRPSRHHCFSLCFSLRLGDRAVDTRLAAHYTPLRSPAYVHLGFKEVL